MTFNLDKVRTKTEEPTGMTLYNMEGEETDAVIFVMSPDSDLFIKTTQEMVKSLNKTRGGKQSVDLFAALESQAQLLAKITTGWDNLSFGDDEKPYEYSYENAVALYTDYPFVREQVNEFAGERANFTKQ